MRNLVWILMIPLLAACGWHLRGVMPLPDVYKTLYLQSSANHDINRQLELQLEFNGVLLTQTAEDATAVLKVQPVTIERRTLSVASSGQIAEYELNGRLQASIAVSGREGETSIEVKSRRILSNDVNNVVGTNAAEQQQRTEMQRELVRKLLRRLQALEQQPAAAQPEPEEG
ncbi:MAG: hypothetical protein CMI02_00280 [Oceanospirillaceae bacterium]|nr:hypothetical protein [Oceanospirillaceae bacterium]MBT10454.1 hypothetical protein [Oceanospirillaceae bacterium]|tara:strand:+ start:24562 stop:25077 length:516 start_codon:yes stop_codon:yes gene_type:complete